MPNQTPETANAETANAETANAETANAETAEAGKPQLGSAPAPQVVVHQHFLNDLSVENPAGVLDARAADARLGQRIEVQVAGRDGDPATFRPGEPTHQITVKVALSADLAEQTIYLAEMRYRALVEIRHLDDPEARAQALFVAIPQALFPAIKEILERTGAYAGYPALTLQPIDFARIYAENRGQ